jgi:hypothetical protein
MYSSTRTTVYALLAHTSASVANRREPAGAPVYVSAYYYICVRVLLYMCPRTRLLYMCRRTSIYVSSYYYICVGVLVCMWSHAGLLCDASRSEASGHIYTLCDVQSLLCDASERPQLSTALSEYYYIRVLVLLYMCPRTTIYVSAYCYTM